MDEDPLGCSKALKKIKPAYKVTKYLEKLIETVPEIKRQFVPSIEELDVDEGEDDPLGEEENLITPRCVHKYEDRILIWTTSYCFSFCRFCTRKRLIRRRESIISDVEVDKIVDYLNQHSEIRDCVLSGGDPLVLNNSQLRSIISKIRGIKNIEIIRIGTRAPIVNPKRVTNRLVNMLKKYNPIFCHLHVNHPSELTDEVKRVCDLMADNGIVLGSQTVLLRGINDSKEVMRSLMQKLLTFRIRPYYLFLADKVQGTKHFWTDEKVGIDIIKYLQETTSGLCVPHFVRDTKERKVLLA